MGHEHAAEPSHADRLEAALAAARPDALRLATRRLHGDVAAAEDVVGDVVLRLWERGMRTGEVYGVGYVVQSVLNGVRSRWRSEQRRAGVRHLLVDGRSPPSPEDQATDRVEVARLLATLPEAQRTVLRLRYLEGLTQEEVAALTGAAQGTVASASARSLGRLRAMAS